MTHNTWLQRLATGAPCTVIAEVAQAHDGSLGMAHAFIDAAATAGADAIKFQTHIAAAESTVHEPWRKRFSLQDDSRYDYWRRMEFSEDQWHGLKRHAEERGLLFLSSPFSIEAVQLLARVGVAAWKVASGEIDNLPLLEAIAAQGQAILLSTGMSTLEEIDQTVQFLSQYAMPLAVMQCSSVYPCPPEYVGLNLIPELRERYGCAVGLSDHSASIFPGLAAATLGIEVLEVHLTLSREMFGPDVSASLTTQELQQLVDGIRYIEHMRAHPLDKSALADKVAPLRDIFKHSVVAAVDLAEGTILEAAHLTTKKPGTGIPAKHLGKLIGMRARGPIARDTLLSWDQVEVIKSLNA